MSQTKNMVIFYVTDIQASVNFYQQLFAEQSPVEQSDVFAMFALPSGLLLGLWRTDTVMPKVLSSGTESELIFSLPNCTDVDKQYQFCQQQQMTFSQTPTMLDFGYSFVVNDPDNHRIRYYFASDMDSNE